MTQVPERWTRELSPADAVLWALDRDPQLRSIVTAVSFLDRPPERDVLQARVAHAVREIPRLRQHVVDPPMGIGLPRWDEVDTVDLDYHLRWVGAISDRPHWLLDFAASLAEAGFDRSRPLWEIVVVEGLEGGQAALVQKVHHSLTDGLGAMRLMLELLDWDPASTSPAILSTPRDIGRMGRFLEFASIAPRLARSMSNPLAAARTGLRNAASASRLLAPGGSRMSPLFVGRSANLRFDIHEESFDSVRQAATKLGGTVNDVFVTAVAGALRRYHDLHGTEIKAVRLNLPVSTRRKDDSLGGNRFVPVRFVLPVAEPDPLKRFDQIRGICLARRREPALPVSNVIAAALSALPTQATVAIMGSLLRGVDVVATNVPGLPRRSYIAGSEMLSEFGFAPLSGAAINLALLSHAGRACIGVNSDRAVIDDPGQLVRCLAEGFAEILDSPIHERRTA